MPYDRSKSEDLKKELQQKVVDLAVNFNQNPADMIEYLKFTSRFYNYSPRNCQLAYSQNHGAMYLGSYKAYQDMGYQVKHGEHGMKILVPTYKTYLKFSDKLVSLSSATAEQKKLYKEKKVETEKKLFFKVGTVFDIAQTTCPAEDYPKYLDLGYSSEQHAQIYKTLKSYCENELDCPVNENAFSSVSLRGYYEPTVNCISISGMFDDTTMLSILSHEMAHAVLHNQIELTEPMPTAQIEFEADAVSVMLQNYFGIEIPDSRLRHLSDNYFTFVSLPNITSKDVISSLDKAHKAYKNIADTVNKTLRPDLTPALTNDSQTTVNSAQQNQPQPQVTQQPIMPSQLPDMGVGGMNFSM